MRNLLATAVIVACLTPGCLLAEALDGQTLSDSRIKMLRYDEADVYTITTRYGYQTNIVFGQGEDIQTISVGDRSLWQIIPTGNRLFIRPMEEGMTTNMTIITNRHSYQFDLKSIDSEKAGGNIYVAKFFYPDSPQNKPAPELPPAAPPSPTPAIAHYAPPPARSAFYPNYNYTYSGDDHLAPLQVYDDGKSTYIEYNPGQPLPAVYATGGGRHQPVSYTVKGNLMVINQIAPELTLESNGGSLHIYNETLNPR